MISLVNEPEIKIRRHNINMLKKKIQESNDKILEHIEGVISYEEFEEIKAVRNGYREEIDVLEAEIAEIKRSLGVSP